MDFLKSSADYLKENAPDLTPVKDSWWSSYNYGRTAVNSVRDSVMEGVNKYSPDDETQAKFGRIGTKIAQNAANYGLEETLKIIPGRDAFDKIVLPAFRDEMAGKAKIFEDDKPFGFENSPQKPEDMIPMFIMNVMVLMV